VAEWVVDTKNKILFLVSFSVFGAHTAELGHEVAPKQKFQESFPGVRFFDLLVSIHMGRNFTKVKQPSQEFPFLTRPGFLQPCAGITVAASASMVIQPVNSTVLSDNNQEGIIENWGTVTWNGQGGNTTEVDMAFLNHNTATFTNTFATLKFGHSSQATNGYSVMMDNGSQHIHANSQRLLPNRRYAKFDCRRY
jgi:hypothetical protein